MHARLRGSKSLITLIKLKLKPDFPSLADEIAEPHPDMNIKVAAFTVSEKSSNTICRYWMLWYILYEIYDCANYVLRKINKNRIQRGMYMSAHVLLILLNTFGKRDKMRGVSSNLLFFRKEFDKFNNTKAHIFDSIYHMILRLF